MNPCHLALVNAEVHLTDPGAPLGQERHCSYGVHTSGTEIWVGPFPMNKVNEHKEQSWADPRTRLRSSWPTSALICRGLLTDRKIDKYVKAGFYSSEYKAARRELWQKRKLKANAKRSGNFLVNEDLGRIIYNPR